MQNAEMLSLLKIGFLLLPLNIYPYFWDRKSQKVNNERYGFVIKTKYSVTFSYM